jgi:hypothetical protein
MLGIGQISEQHLPAMMAGRQGNVTSSPDVILVEEGLSQQTRSYQSIYVR